jgi:hypothetical protein
MSPSPTERQGEKFVVYRAGIAMFAQIGQFRERALFKLKFMMRKRGNVE